MKTLLSVQKESLHLINDGLHVTLVLVIPIEQGRPLLRADTQPRLHRHADNLTIMLAPQTLIRAKLKETQWVSESPHRQATYLFFELHEG